MCGVKFRLPRKPPLTPGPDGPAGPGSACKAPQLRDSLQNLVLGEQGELIRKTGHTWLTSQAGGPQAALGEYVFERFPLKHNH